MSTAFSAAPLTDDVAGALAQFFYGGAGPSHTDITRVLTQSGYFDNYVRPSTGQGPNKQDRVLRAFREAHAAPARARQLVDGMLGLLRLKNLIGDPDDDQKSDDERQLRRALGAAGWHLDDTGHLHPFAGVDVDSGGREALDEMLARIRRSTADPGLLIGQAKDLLEAVAKFVLEELGMPVHKNMPTPPFGTSRGSGSAFFLSKSTKTCLDGKRSGRFTSPHGPSRRRSTPCAISKGWGTDEHCPLA